MTRIMICPTAEGVGLALPARANALDGGVDVRSAITFWMPPFRRSIIPLGFVYRWEPKIVERDGSLFTKTIEVVKKGSGLIGFEPQAVVFDAGFFPKLDDSWGISLIVANLCPWWRKIKRGQKVAQLVVREVVLAEFLPASMEELRAVPQLDSRGPGRLGSTGR